MPARPRRWFRLAATLPPEPFEITVADTCVANGALIADLDRDGTDEAYPLAAFRDPAAAEIAAEIAASRYTGSACKRRFTWHKNKVGPDLVDVLGAGDFDQDGRLELVIAGRSAGRTG